VSLAPVAMELRIVHRGFARDEIMDVDHGCILPF
jgi:hypothetical protein